MGCAAVGDGGFGGCVAVGAGGVWEDTRRWEPGRDPPGEAEQPRASLHLQLGSVSERWPERGKESNDCNHRWRVARQPRPGEGD